MEAPFFTCQARRLNGLPPEQAYPPTPRRFLQKILLAFLSLNASTLLSMKRIRMFALCLLACFWLGQACQPGSSTDRVQQWHPLTLSFEGPETREQAVPNPFLDYRLNVRFEHADTAYLVPGFYAADGQAAETSAEAGNVWQVHFTPDRLGAWTYTASFRQGPQVAISDEPEAGEAVAFDGESGHFEVIPSDKTGRDFRAHGKLRYVGKRYLQFAGSKQYYLKAGAGSPENLLAYEEFDGPRPTHENLHESREGEAPEAPLHQYVPHVQDWKEGDPTWQGVKGKGLIGGLNYLASKGINDLYFLTMNVGGDGNDVWPWTSPEERYRFDCSKLAQWEVVFSHMDQLGMMLHVITQETENELLLDHGDTGPQRKLYYRELIARFGHHLAVSWNLGEENGPANFSPDGQTHEQQKAMASYFKAHDPYRNFVALHTHANPRFRDSMFEALLRFEDLDGASLQIARPQQVHEATYKWVTESNAAGKPWVCFLDEIGPHTLGVLPDSVDPQHDTIRSEALWGNLMAGGAGTAWYFGYKFPNDDLSCEDWRSRDAMWEQTRHAVAFFQEHLPFPEMHAMDALALPADVHVFAKPGDTYALYLPPKGSGEVRLDLSDAEGTYRIQWYNPRTGGALRVGSLETVKGGTEVALGMPPAEPERDWVVLLTNAG